MGKGIAITAIVLALVIGLAGGTYAGYKYYPTKHKTSQETNSSTTTSATESTDSAELVTCLKAKWGEDKYTAITANPSLASVDDKFNALPCYK